MDGPAVTREEASRRIKLSIDRQLAGEIANDWQCPGPIQVEGPYEDASGVERVLVTTLTGAWLVAEDGSLSRPVLS